MADQQEAYQAAMREASSAAWDHDWERAVSACERALRVFPDDPQALALLASSLMELARYPEALSAYQRVGQLVPNDPLPFEKIAEIQEFLGQIKEAAKTYMNVGELHFARRDVSRAVLNWEQAVRLEPDLAQAHYRLATVYERNPKKHPQAVIEYLILARLLQQYGQIQRAEQALQRAANLDPINPDVRNAQGDLKSGKPIQPVQLTPPEESLYPQPSAEVETREEQEPLPPSPKEPTPIEEAAKYAMGLLADMVFSDQIPSAARVPLVKATELHQIALDSQQPDDIEKAITAYTKTFEAGVDHPALRFNLGTLYQQARRFRDALGLLSQVAEIPEYSIACNLSLGLVYFSLDEYLKAAQCLVQALRLADQRLNPQPDRGGYERLLSSLNSLNTDHLVELCKALALYLNDGHWQAKLTQTLAGYASQGKASYVPDLIELVIEGGRPQIAEIMQRIDHYMQRNMMMLAMEEAHHAIEKSPDYLPAHRRMADILIKEGRAQEAATKINLVANTYLIRGNEDKAADLFMQVIDLWPADMAARQRVIDMLKRQGRVAEALRQYGDMAGIYHRLMADTDKAVEVYSEALHYAEQNKAEPTSVIPILKALADIESQRLNWNKALGYYMRVLELDPEDESSVLALIDLHFQSNDPVRAIAALDAYMKRCIERNDVERALSTLEDQVRRRPDEIGLRQRLAEVYRQQNRIPEAIAQLDALGELQLDAGRRDDAVKTIRQIIALNPPGVEGYRQLLEQLESSVDS